jgi:uncharacterized membrane protein
MPVVSAAPPAERPMVSVFVPCTPNPTTGFFFYIAANEVIELPISAHYVRRTDRA